jgi:hypothetical protein
VINTCVNREIKREKDEEVKQKNTGKLKCKFVDAVRTWIVFKSASKWHGGRWRQGLNDLPDSPEGDPLRQRRYSVS